MENELPNSLIQTGVGGAATGGAGEWNPAVLQGVREAQLLAFPGGFGRMPRPSTLKKCFYVFCLFLNFLIGL